MQRPRFCRALSGLAFGLALFATKRRSLVWVLMVVPMAVVRMGCCTWLLDRTIGASKTTVKVALASGVPDPSGLDCR